MTPGRVTSEEEALVMISQASGMDRERVLEFKGRAARYLQILALSIPQDRLAIGEVRQLIRDGSAEQASQVVHRLSGSSAMLGLQSFSRCAAELALLLREQGDGDPVARKAAELDQCLQEIECSVVPMLPARSGSDPPGASSAAPMA